MSMECGQEYFEGRQLPQPATPLIQKSSAPCKVPRSCGELPIAEPVDETDLETAALVIKTAKGRESFTWERLLPDELSHAVQQINQSLPSDPLTASLALLCGYSGLLRIGTRINSTHTYGVPCNLFLALVGKSGQMKTPILKNLVIDPAAEIRADVVKDHQRRLKAWKDECQGIPKDDRPSKPRPYWCHLNDYTPESLAIQLEVNEPQGKGLLLIRDEIAGMLQSLDADDKRGRGTGNAQLLELFDGTGSTSIRVEGGFRCFEQCHVSVVGNIQPEKLKRLINNNDCTGKFARFLCCQIPRTVPLLRDSDPTDNEIRNYTAAQQYLKTTARRIYSAKPKCYNLSSGARTLFHTWFSAYQHQVLECEQPVIGEMFGKTSAHALRLAGMLHIVRSGSGIVSAETMQLAMDIVDQLIGETRLLHDRPTGKVSVLANAISSLKGEITWTTLKAKKSSVRKMEAADFRATVMMMQQQGLGVITKQSPLTFRATSRTT